MPMYGVTIPIAGNVFVEVEAENEEQAKELAMEKDITVNDISEWETLERFNEGNVCHCPSPWEIAIIFMASLILSAGVRFLLCIF